MSYSVLSETILPLLNFFLEVKDSVYDSAIRKRVGRVSIHGRIPMRKLPLTKINTICQMPDEGFLAS